jgi:PRTRC genetic system protein E
LAVIATVSPPKQGIEKMIEQLTQLLQDAKINRLQLNLSITPNTDKVSVTINTFVGSTATDSNEANQLREALSRPLMIRGDKGEVDVELVNMLHQYTEHHANAVEAFKNTANVVSGLEQATKKAKAKTASTKTATTSSASKVDSTEVAEPVKAPDVSREAFETDDIDSL